MIGRVKLWPSSRSFVLLVWPFKHVQDVRKEG
jgi:hypothetical protein